MLNIEQASALPGHSQPVYSLLFQDPTSFLSGGAEGGVVCWDATTLIPKVLFKTNSPIYALNVVNGLIISASRSGKIHAFNKNTGELRELNYHTQPVFDIKAIENTLYAVSEDGFLSCWDLQTLDLITTVRVSTDTLRTLVISPDATHIAIGCRDKFIRILHRESLGVVAELNGHTLPVFSLAFTPDGNYLISGSRDASIRIWDFKSFLEVHRIPAHLFAVNHLLFHPSGLFFASASMDKSIKVWDAETFQLLKIMDEKRAGGHKLSVNKLAWNPAGTLLLSGGNDRVLMTWKFSY